jgi:protein-S-isoprenylcysteine O-methyltransferase Ste14
LPLVGGLVITATAGDLFPVQSAGRVLGWVLLGGFVVWSSWTLSILVVSRTAVLPGGATWTILDRGSFRVSRNPLHLGLIASDAAVALL